MATEAKRGRLTHTCLIGFAFVLAPPSCTGDSGEASVGIDARPTDGGLEESVADTGLSDADANAEADAASAEDVVEADARAGGEELFETAEGEWGLAFGPDDRGLLLSAWGRSDDDVYLVGGTAESTLILHYDGAVLRSLDNPGDRLAWWVFGVDGGVYVVGERGLLLRRDADGSWEDRSIETEETLYGIWGASEAELWAAGGSFPDGQATLFHVVGDDVSQQELPQTASGRRALFKVWGTSADDVFAVGEDGVVLAYDGSDWTSMAFPSNTDLLTVHGRADDDVWAVGGRGSASIWHFDGAVWRDVTPPEASSGLNGVFVPEDAAVEVAGNFGLLVSWDDAQWLAEPIAAVDALHAVWCSQESCWAVGGNLAAYPVSPHGVIYRHAPLRARLGSNCVVPNRCGDGVVACGEACDDGNRTGGDYCATDCLGVTGECGDDVVQTAVEICDDGNTDLCVGECGADCQTTPNRCGDGHTACGEGCDDGNIDLGDDCPDGSNGSCQPAFCGDGFVRAVDENCDGANLDGFDCRDFGFTSPGGLACSSGCELDMSGCGATECGNGIMEVGEGCDDGDLDTTDECPDGPGATCQPAFCGDGFVWDGAETCDVEGAPLCDADCNPSCDGLGPPCDEVCLGGEGTHRLYLQGRNGRPDCLGRYPMVVDENDLVHGEHYLFGEGSFVEWVFALCADITDEISFYIPNNDFSGSEALHELRLRRQGQDDVILGTAVDDEPGESGYNPFTAVPADAVDADVQAGDELVLRTTNLNDVMYSVMIFNPPSEYESWVEVVVPADAPELEPVGPACSESVCDLDTGLELGSGTMIFEPLDASNHIEIVVGPQGSLMIPLSLRFDGILPGDPGDRDTWPRVDIVMSSEDDPLIGFLSQDTPFVEGPGGDFEAYNLVLSIDPDTHQDDIADLPHNLSIIVTDVAGTTICLDLTVVPTS